jgi:hypothetical protein
VVVRRRIVLVVAAVLALGGGWLALRHYTQFPPDTTPDGAYLRIAHALSLGRPEECFSYLEQDAQDASYTILDYARKARTRIAESYPEPDRTRALAPYGFVDRCADPPALWAELAAERAWLGRLRRDLSGIDHVEIAGERATVVTARGTRYPFRRRPNGIWGLTVFTAELTSEAERLARDWDRIQQAAADYDRGKGK